MKAEDVRMLELLAGPKQFIVPIFQRDYSWGTRQCAQLFDDVLRAGSDEDARAHFIGSVVYIAAEENTALITRWLLIDGQQRLTTLTLLLIALRNLLSERMSTGNALSDELPSVDELDDYYLRNVHARDERRYKLHLRRTDQHALASLVDRSEWEGSAEDHIAANFQYFTERLVEVDLDVVYRGISKLVAVDVSLTRGHDDPQMIFESLNSTGLDLTQADLIRNFVLMRQDENVQTALYENYWQPIEVDFGPRYRSDFDKFIRDYLTLELRPSKHLRTTDVYELFRGYYRDVVREFSVEEVLDRIKRFGRYYASFGLSQETDLALRAPMIRLRRVVEVASPVVMKLYDCYEQVGSLSRADFVKALELLESYVFRRSVCGMETRSLGQIFASLSYRIKEETPLSSLEVALFRQNLKRRFPSDTEFKEALETRDVYDMRHSHYLLDRLENDSKEKIDTSTLTIEHVMPQTEKLRPQWKEMLGPEWKEVHEVWLHRLGNLTLTGYNSEYSDLPFSEKQTIAGGFQESPLRLNRYIAQQEAWGAAQMEERGRALAARATSIWRPLTVDHEAVRKADLEERVEQASRFNIQDIPMGEGVRALLEHLRPRVVALGEEVTELPTVRSVTYRVHEFFLEVVPRRGRLLLVLNLDYADLDDPSQRATDASDYAFIPHATETGGILLNLSDEAQLEEVMHVVRQAFARVAE